jgi:hypothetical protein
MSELSRYRLVERLLSIGTVSSLTLLIATIAPANSSQPSQGKESQQLADLRLAENQQISQLSVAVPPPLPATLVATESTVPQFQPPSAPAVITEDELIRQVSQGDAVPRLAAPVKPATLITASPNSDVGLRLGDPQKIRFETPLSEVRGINPEPANSATWTAPSTPLPTADTTRAEVLSQTSGSGAAALVPQNRTIYRSSAITEPSLTLQGVYLYQGDTTSARARLSGTYPLSPNILVGGTLDVVTGNAFTDTPNAGFNVNELYVAIAPREVPNLRFVLGQIDLTSYFDRNSFAKDGASHFFNPVFQTNPALSAAGITSRPGALVNFSLNDNIEAKAAVFSSARGLSEFSLDGFAGEVGIRYGNLIVRGTYSTARDAGSNSGFQEIFAINRGNGQFGLRPGDREEGYGVNAELFIPEAKLGLFGRYGRYNNRDLSAGGDTFSAGITFLDLFARDDRLGLAYGQGLSDVGRRQSGKKPDVLEVFYDFRLLSNLRLGFSLQSRDGFTDTIAGIRLKTEFDVTPRGKNN